METEAYDKKNNIFVCMLSDDLFACGMRRKWRRRGRYAGCALSEEVSSETALRYYGIDSVQVQDSAVYMSTGATAEELAVFQASSTVAAQGILADMKKRRDSQLQMYLDYKSSETARLDDAILYVHDTFVVYMVSDDSETAKGIISDYLE